jgi:anthranilate phosphoribosyltransferase
MEELQKTIVEKLRQKDPDMNEEEMEAAAKILMEKLEPEKIARILEAAKTREELEEAIFGVLMTKEEGNYLKMVREKQLKEM